MRFLPFLVADLIPTEDDHWEHYLLLMTITDYIFAPTTTNGIIAYLKMSIEDFLTDFRQLYPDRRVTPKLHYLLHVPSYMSRLEANEIFCLVDNTYVKAFH